MISLSRSLIFEGCDISSATELSSKNARLMEQRGSIGKAEIEKIKKEEGILIYILILLGLLLT